MISSASQVPWPVRSELRVVWAQNKVHTYFMYLFFLKVPSLRLYTQQILSKFLMKDITPQQHIFFVIGVNQ